MLKYILLIGSILISSHAFGYGEDKIQKLKWENLDVVFLEDEKFPTYDLNIYFGDGALSDASSRRGETEWMFSLISSGTRRFSQRDIAETLEFYGVGHGGSVNHEYVSYSVSGLVKDIVPTMKQVCHLFQDATFPIKEIKKAKKLATNGFKNLITNHGGLASRAFREISLRGTPFDYPTGGKLRDVKKHSQKRLKNKLAYFNQKVKKRIYITGPKDILKVKDIINNECGWKGQGQFVREVSYKEKKAKAQVVLVTVPKANQAQVRIGRFLNPGEYKEAELLNLTTEFLGGGFTSRLMRELRVKHGLTYSAGAFAAGQKNYGRSGISTFTKVETVGKLLKVTKDTLDTIISGSINPIDFTRAKGALAGSYPFRFEQNSAYLAQLLFLDHIGQPYSKLYKFPEIVRSYSAKNIQDTTSDIFGWNKQTIVVLGPKSLVKQLKEFGHVIVVPYKKYL